MLLLDVTASMNWATSPTDDTPRRETVREALSLLVQSLGEHDSQAGAEHQAGIATEEIGGLRTVTFSGHNAQDIGDLNEHNLAGKWDAIKFQGGTYIVPGWQRILQVYQSEFGSRPVADQPVVMLLVITDGAALDIKDFANLLTHALPANFFVSIALVGFDFEYLKALKEYTAVAAAQPQHIRIVPFGATTDPRCISSTLLSMAI